MWNGGGAWNEEVGLGMSVFLETYVYSLRRGGRGEVTYNLEAWIMRWIHYEANRLTTISMVQNLDRESNHCGEKSEKRRRQGRKCLARAETTTLAEEVQASGRRGNRRGIRIDLFSAGNKTNGGRQRHGHRHGPKLTARPCHNSSERTSAAPGWSSGWLFYLSSVPAVRHGVIAPRQHLLIRPKPPTWPAVLPFGSQVRAARCGAPRWQYCLANLAWCRRCGGGWPWVCAGAVADRRRCRREGEGRRKRHADAEDETVVSCRDSASFHVHPPRRSRRRRPVPSS